MFILKKRIIVFSAIVVVGAVLFFAIYKLQNTTYKEVMSEMIGNKEVTNLTIIDWENDREFNTENEEIINKLLSEPSSMEMRKSSASVDVDYTIFFETNTGEDYDMGLGKSNVTISHSGGYKFINGNALYEIIKNNDWEWRAE